MWRGLKGKYIGFYCGKEAKVILKLHAQVFVVQNLMQLFLNYTMH